MDNKVSIKSVYLYNKDQHNKATKKEKKKRISWTIVSLLVTLISTFGIVYMITNDKLTSSSAILGFSLMALSLIFFFCFMYNFFSLASFLTQKVIFSDRAYAITNSDEIITFKYERNSPYFRYNVLRGNLLDEIVKILALQISVSKENKEMIEKINDKNLALNDLYECLDIKNVYKIKEKEDRIEIVCDYVDLIRNTSCKQQSLTIYKYYENWEELLKNLKIQKNKIKESLTQQDGKHSGFVDFVLRSSLRKSNAIWFHGFVIFALISSIKEEYLFAIWLEFGIAILTSVLYSQNKALKYLYNNDNSKKEFLLSKIRNNKIVLAIYSMLLIAYSLIKIKEILVIVITAICIFVILFIIKKRIEK